MANPAMLARDLTTITSLPFEVKDGVVTCTVESTPAQHKMLSRACGESGLLMRQKRAIDVSGRAVDLPEIPVGEISDSAADKVSQIAEGEGRRVARLENLRDLLIEKTGIGFGFDEGHKMLVAQDPLTVGIRWQDENGDLHRQAPGTTASPVVDPHSRAKMGVVTELSKAKAIDLAFISPRSGSSEIAVFDIDEKALRNARGSAVARLERESAGAGIQRG